MFVQIVKVKIFFIKKLLIFFGAGVVVMNGKKRMFQKGRLNPNWKGGVADYPNHYFMKKQRLIILLHNPKCEICGKLATEIHHRNGNKSDHKLRNLMASCRKCNCRIRFKPNASKYRRLYGKSLGELSKEFKLSYQTIRYRIKNNIPLNFPKYLSLVRKEHNSKYRRLYGMSFLELTKLGKEKYNLLHWEIARKLKRKEYPFSKYLVAKK